MSETETADFNKAQRQVLLMPAIWILALSSAFMYISRYAINSWGVFIWKLKGLLHLGCQFYHFCSSGLWHNRYYVFQVLFPISYLVDIAMFLR